MGFAEGQPRIWPAPPVWTNGVRESLAWATESLRSSATLVSSHRSYRIGPARSFSFDVLADSQEHRALEMLLAGYRGVWQLPIWHDVKWLSSTVDAGALEIPCTTSGFDFVAGGKALLFRSVNAWEVVTIDAIEPDRLALVEATADAFGPGDRLFPLRSARMQEGSEASMLTDSVSRRQVTFDVAEPCDWPALSSPAEYLGYPVLDERPDETDDPIASFAGERDVVDFGVGAPVIGDLAGFALRSQRDSWQMRGRAQHSWFRSLLYTLRGRQRPMWVPSWQSDMAPAGAIAGGSTALPIQWCGYTLFALGKPNRRDLRIELRDGTVFYRRVVDAVGGADFETLTLDAPLDAASISPGRIHQISIMALCTLASDSTEITHVTDADGVATAVTGWQGVVPHV